MEKSDEFDLVIKALTSGLSNCVLWKDDKTEHRIQSDRFLLGWTPKAIKRELIRCVKSGEAVIRQVEEMRAEYKNDYKCFYDVVLPIDDFQDGLYVEMVLHDEDEECPVVVLVNSHPEVPRKRFR